MHTLYEELLGYLIKEDKEKAVKLCISALESEKINVVALYEQVLTTAINHIIMEYEDDEDNLIWKEHIRSGIIRTIVESAYPYVLRDREKMGKLKNQSIIIMCPRFEEHELGARMVSDFFTIAGFDATFIGANTPERTIIKAVESLKPDYISMSVTNYYNLIAAKKTIDIIKEKFDYNIIFLLGGNAFNKNPEACKEIGGDMVLKSFQDIINLNEGVESK